MASSMSNVHARSESSRVASIQSLPPLCTIITSTSLCNEDGLSIASTRTSADAAFSNELTSTCDSLPKPPQCERLNSKPSFRRARFCASPPPHTGGVSVQDVNDSISKEAPNALVAHVHDGTMLEASNMIPIGSPLDFGNAFNNSLPSFIIVESCEQSANLAIEMLKDQAEQSDGIVIIVLVQQDQRADFEPIVKKVPDFLASGAHDVVVIPADATNINSLISVSLAKAQASRDQKMKFKKQIQASENQCHRLFWKIAHEIIPDFPQIQTRLHEIHEKRVGSIDLVRKLGEGSFGSVYKWKDERQNDCGAVKVFAKSKVHSATHAMQIATEIALLERLKHTNVVTFLGTAHGMKCVYLFMELAGAMNLFQVIRAEGAQGLPWSCAAGFFSQIAAGVAHCHKMQVAHCDLKPENIVISESGCAKVVDFGQAVDLTEDVPSLQNLLGTMPFTAPEIMLFCPDWNPPAADVWSLAVILVEMLCGNHAFVRLLGWHSLRKKLTSRLAQCADELRVFFAKDETNAHGKAIMAISGLCQDVPPPPVMELLGKMLVFMPEERILAESAAECIENILI